MKPYIPDELPLENLDYGRLIRLIGPANAALARYDGQLRSIINPHIMLSPLIMREAVLSSKIEGTQATVDEVLEFEAGEDFDTEKSTDIQEIRNYRMALLAGRSYVDENPISLWLIRQMHEVLMESVRGKNKSPGEFRKEQNWIGSPGCLIEQATFVPPSPMILQSHLEAWERYIASDDLDVLLQIAIVHAQFELLHPFNDGNGRIGRLLIPLFLYQKKALTSPMFYLSEYLESHRDEYYAGLKNISAHGDWNGWIAFFLEAIRIQAEENTLRVNEMQLLYEEMKQRVTELTRSQNVIVILDTLFSRPIFNTINFAREANLPAQSVRNYLRTLREEGILTTLREARGRKPALMAFPALLNLAQGQRVF